MRRSSLRMSAFLRSSVSLALTVSMVAGAGAAGTPKGGAAATGALSITTDPDNAAVYVDGRLVGQTPAHLTALSAGEHRVRIVKSGYLENSRVVAVPAGQPTRLNVKLTATPEISNPAAGQVTSAGGGGGGGIPKWVWIAIAAGGAVGVVAALPKNKAPVGGTIGAPANALQATSVAFISQGATDPDGDALTFTWNFGDGGTATGTTVAHTYTTAGTFAVKLTVSDGKKSVEVTANVTIKSLTGTWRGNIQSITTFNTTLTLTQNGANITGSYADQTSPARGVGSISGSVDAANGRVNFTTTVPGFTPFTFSGTPSADVNTLTGTANGSGFTNAPWTVTRS